MKKYSCLALLLIINTNLFSQDFALEQLEKSPRHHEWVKVEANGRTVHSFVAYPEKSENTTSVIVIHENRGLTDWVRSMADQLAAAGYTAIAPDLLSEFAQDINKTSDFENSDEARNAIYELNPDQVTQDLNTVYRYIADIPSSNGKVAVMGFCWGGSQTFRFATNNQQIDAALVFYGTGPDQAEAIKNINAPVYGFYGGNDQRVNATIENSENLMKGAGKDFKYEIYPGAGHAYMRSGDDPQGSKENKQAREESWNRIKRILNDL